MKKVLILLIAVPLLAFNMHKFYVSMCEVEYVPDKASVQIIIGFFIDDIELALNEAYGQSFKLDTPDEQENSDEYLEKYLNTHLQLKLNGAPESYQYIGKEYDLDLVRFYLEITDIESLDIFELENTCLIQQFDDQKNIIKLKVKNFHKTFYLDKKKHNCLLKFQ